MTRIIGIDPGLQHTGWGIIESRNNSISFVACGVINSDAKQQIPQRLKYVHNNLSSIIEKYAPQEAAVEETFINKNAGSSLKLGHARGAILLTLALCQLDIIEYSANIIKKSIVGKGHAEKAQVAQMVKILLPASSAEKSDAADALAAAITHAHMRKISSL